MKLVATKRTKMPIVFAKSIEEFFERDDKFHEELIALRDIFTSTKMEEEFKWNIPAYCLKGKNVAGLASFKNYVGIWFHQGVFLKDDHKKLMNAQEEKTKGMRQWRFDSMEQIKKDKHIILAYLEEAIENQKLGKEIKMDTKKKLVISDEMQKWLTSDGKLKTAFEKLSPGKQREYADYISEAKRVATKESRLEKITPMIVSGVGLHDKYKNC